MKLQRIRDLREDCDMTQDDLAKILHIGQRTLSHYELGTRNIPVELLKKIAEYFDCSVDYILERTNNKK